MEEQSKRGRPLKIPKEGRKHIKLVLVQQEHENLKRAMAASGMNQPDFARASVLSAVDEVLGVKPATPRPKPRKK